MTTFREAWSNALWSSRLIALLWFIIGLGLFAGFIMAFPTIRTPILPADVEKIFSTIEEINSDFLPQYVNQSLWWLGIASNLIRSFSFILLAYFIIKPNIDLYFFELLIFVMLSIVVLEAILWLVYLLSLPQTIYVYSHEIVVTIATYPWLETILALVKHSITPIVFWAWLLARKRKPVMAV